MDFQKYNINEKKVTKIIIYIYMKFALKIRSFIKIIVGYKNEIKE